MHDFSVEITFNITYNLSAMNGKEAEELAKEKFIEDYPDLKHEDFDVTGFYREDEDD